MAKLLKVHLSSSSNLRHKNEMSHFHSDHGSHFPRIQREDVHPRRRADRLHHITVHPGENSKAASRNGFRLQGLRGRREDAICSIHPLACDAPHLAATKMT